MKKILITGGTAFVSRYAAEYFVERNYDVYVLNRNSKQQVNGVRLLGGDRHNLGGRLKGLHFDVVADITAYDAADRKFYLPRNGEIKLQFLHVKDLCGIMEALIETKPADKIMNVGNAETVSIKDWATKCYACFRKTPVFVNVTKEIG